MSNGSRMTRRRSGLSGCYAMLVDKKDLNETAISIDREDVERIEYLKEDKKGSMTIRQEGLSGPLVFGLQIGMRKDDIRNVFPSAKFNNDGFSLSKDDLSVIEQLEEKAMGVDGMFGTFIDGRLEFLFSNFSSNAYNWITSAIFKKYGKPSAVQNFSVQNRMGATFTNEFSKWEFSDGTVLTLERYGDDLNTGRLWLKSKYFQEQQIKNPPKEIPLKGF